MSEQEHVSPIRPEQTTELKIKNLPYEVIEATNTILVNNLSGAYGQVSIKELTDLLKSIDFDVSSIKDKQWVFTLASKFIAEGWKVDVEYPSMDDNFDPYIRFTDPSKDR
ncbi:MAG: hypothetical protein JWN12_867 [Candidatus Saccharibacteria bacterium]|nr:hypothetical protein [Candidatus Saccharibacteria bacterium]